MIRKATLSDVASIEELGLRLKMKTPYALWPYDRERALKQIRNCISSPIACAFVAEANEMLVGVILGVAQEMWFSKSRCASDLMFYSERAGAGYWLLRRFMAWAWGITSVKQILLGQSSGLDIDMVERMYMRLNFRKVGGLYELGRFD
jgi:hypothetical protein